MITHPTPQIYILDPKSHRLFGDSTLDNELDRIEKEFKNTKKDEDFLTILKQSQKNHHLRNLFKVILNNRRLLQKFGSDQERSRLTQELQKILTHPIKNLLDYFMFFEDAAYFFSSRGKIANFGRGSSAGCYLNYLLGITKVDPLKHNLLFERFMSENRMPDIDFDMGSPGCSTMFENYLKEKFGNNLFGVAWATYHKADSALISVLAELNIPLSDPEKNQIRTAVRKVQTETGNPPFYQPMPLTSHLLSEDPLLSLLFKFNPNLEKLMNDKVGSIKGYNSAPVGYVLTKDPSMFSKDDLVPSRNPIIPTTIKNSKLEEFGIEKLDFIKSTLYENLNTIGSLLDLENIDWDNKTQFKIIFSKSNAERINEKTIFYSKAPFPILSVSDMAVWLVISRKEFKENNLWNTWEELKLGIDHYFQESQGRLIFQEDFMRFLNEIGGFSVEDSFKVLKNTGKRHHDKIQEYRTQFITNIQKHHPNLIPLAEDIWSFLVNRSSFLFLHAHALAWTHAEFAMCYFTAIEKSIPGMKLAKLKK